MANIKISQLPAKGANLASTDLVEISEFTGTGYISKSITGQEIIDAASGGSGVTDVTASAPLSSSGGTTPDISMPQADAGTDGYLSTTDFINFTNKQEALVSGTNIKTLNGASLLGSGGLSVQPTLVSGTNIKTINGNSVLGTGDLTISGGGLQGVHNVLNYFPSTAFGIDASISAASSPPQATTTNLLSLYPFIPNKTITSVSLKIAVTTLGVGVNARILIYSDLNGFPNTKLYESANLDCSSLGNKTALTTFTFNAGTTYWLGLHSSGIASLTHINSQSLIPLYITNAGSSSITQYTSTIAFGSAPSTYTYSSQNTGAVPRIVINLS